MHYRYSEAIPAFAIHSREDGRRDIRFGSSEAHECSYTDNVSGVEGGRRSGSSKFDESGNHDIVSTSGARDEKSDAAHA